MTYQILIDETAQDGLSLLEKLDSAAESVDRIGDGEYTVTGNPKQIDAVISKYPLAVLKMEEVK